MTHAFKRNALRLALLPGSALLCGNVLAACSSTPAMPNLQTLDNIAVAANLGVGQTIPGSVRRYAFSGKCDKIPPAQEPGSLIVACYYGSGTEIMPGVYSSGISGLGLRLRNAAGQPIQNAASIWCDTRGASLGTINADMTYAVAVSIELVKTGPIATGKLDPVQTRFGFGVYQGDGLGGDANYIGFSGSVQVREIACNPVYPSVIRLPKVSASTLAAAGATAGSTPFSITLNCNGAARVGVTFDVAGGSTVKSAPDGILGPGNEGTAGAARGIGLQLINARSAEPVPLQQINPVGNISANAPATYPYVLKYRALTANATPGIVSGAMTFTFDYQ